MDLAKRFAEATAYATLNISSLENNKLFPIVNAKRVTTKYGQTVFPSVRESEVPKIYCAVISDDDMDKINTKAVSLYLLSIRAYVRHPNHTYWE